MSEKDDKGGVDLDFDWDDALADWERDLDDQSTAESAPMPQKPTVEPAKEPARALYRPPDPAEFTRPSPRTPMARPAPPPIVEEVNVSFDDDDEEEEHTRIASIPKELIASLVAARQEPDAHRASTRPPPALESTPGSAPAVDLDLDDMLDGLDQDTRAYPQELPRIVSPIRTRPPGPPDAASMTWSDVRGSEEAAPRTNAPTAPPPGSPRPPPPGTTPTPRPDALDAPLPEIARPAALPRVDVRSPDAGPDRSDRVMPPPPPRMSAPGVGARVPRPGVVPPPSALGRPLVPPPGGLPAVPRPGAPRAVVPPPGAARPMPAVPRPGAERPKVLPPSASRSSSPPSGLDNDDALARADLDLPDVDSLGERDGASGVEMRPEAAEPAARPSDGASAGAPSDAVRAGAELDATPSTESGAVELAGAPSAGRALDGLPSSAARTADVDAPPSAPHHPEHVDAPVGAAGDGAQHATPSAGRIAESDLEDAFFDAPPVTRRSSAPRAMVRDEGLAALDAALEAASAPSPLAADDDLLFLDDLEALPTTSPSASAPEPAPPETAPARADRDVAAPGDADPFGGLEPFTPDADADAPATLDGADDEPIVEADERGADDEPIVEADEPDADEPVIEASDADAEPVIGAGDDDEPLLEASDALDDEELGPAADDEVTTIAASAPAPSAPAARTGPDRGAAAARRTVRSRKPRVEVFPLVGRSADALAARRELLLQMASSAEGDAKARLLVAVAEIDHRLGRRDDARASISAAREADPRDVVALRAARRDAIERGAPADAAALLEAETKLPLSKAERGSALLALAELQLQQLGDSAAAEKAALEAFALSPRSVIAALLMAEARAAGGRESASVDALRRAGEACNDRRVRSVLLVSAARDAEKCGDPERALELYGDALEADPEAIEARLGVARGTRGKAQAEALDAIARALPEGLLRDTFARRAARALLVASGGEPREAARRAVEILESARTLPALRTRALAATRAADADSEISALEAWAGASGGTDRALALVRLAEAHAAAGDLDSADETLRAASLADASLSTIRIVREVLARRSGDRGRLVQAVEAAGALAASAKLAAESSTETRERELVGQARREDESPLCAEVLWLDLAAAAGDADEVALALRREVDRAPPEQRTGALLALADRAVQIGDVETAEKTLREARELAPGDPVVLRPLGRLTAAQSAAASAAVWLEEASAASGPRAAFAASAAGLLLEHDGDAIGAYRAALDAVPGYPPALWSLPPVARAAGDVATLHEVHEQTAEAASEPVESASHLVRAALLRADADPVGASALLARAREKTPGDAVLVDLSLRLIEGLSPQQRAELSLGVAVDAPAALGRAIRLSAAASLEDAGEPARAAELYRALVAEDAGDALASLALDRAEIHAGELARVAERRFAAVRDASSDAQRLIALERLAELDIEERDDAASGVLSLHAILELAPGHVPSLRTLERYYLEQDRRDDLIAIEERFVAHLGDPADVAVHLRFASRLQLMAAEARGDASDELLLRASPRARIDAWLARRVAAAARAAGAGAVAASMDAEIAARATAPIPRATAFMRAAESRAAMESGAAAASALLQPAVEAAPDHPAAAELLATLCESANDLRGAAEALGIAARAARVPGHAASLWYRAGVLWQDTIGDEERALDALVEASRIDVGHLDVFDRLRNLLELREDAATLSELVARRTAVGGDPAFLVELHALQAKLQETLGHREAAKDALRSALALSPEKVDALKRLAELSLEDEDYRNAAEALIRIARVRKDRDELRWVFSTLGEIYDEHIPDPKRAEAAYRRVLKLLPDDVAAMERLARIFRREGQLQAAAEQLSELSRVEPDPDRARGHQLSLAEVLEQMGDARRAEQVLESARRTSPTEIVTLEALAKFYDRQGAQSAQAMHLNRAVGDFRHALAADLSDAAAWLGLLEVLRWRGRVDAARCVASTAFAIGIDDVDVTRLLDAAGGAPGAGAAAADATLDDMVSPAGLPAALRAVMRVAGSSLEKVLPFDPRAYRAEKLGQRDGGLRGTALEIARSFGIGDVEIWITPSAPRVCVPVSGGPPIALLIGRDLLAIDERERAFVLARALKIAREGLSVAVRTQPQDLSLAMAGLVHSFDQHYQPPGIEPAVLADWGRRVTRQLPRRATDELGPVVFEMAGSHDYDPARMAMAASELGDRIALLSLGSVPAAVSALLKLSGEAGLAETPSARVAQLRRFPEVLALASFAVSDVHFEARSRAGLDRT